MTVDPLWVHLAQLLRDVAFETERRPVMAHLVSIVGVGAEIQMLADEDWDLLD